MATIYESLADQNKYVYLVKSNTTIPFGTLNKIECSPHFHKNVEFLFITKGKQQVNVDGSTFEIKEGDIIYVNSYEPHSYMKSDAEGYVLVLSTFYFETFNNLYSNKRLPRLMNDSLKNKEIIEYVSNWEFESRKNPFNPDYYSTFVKANILIDNLVKKYGVEDKVVSKQNALVADLLKYINLNFKNDISLEKCAKELGYTKEYVSMVFHSIIGESFRTYLNRTRIEYYLSIKEKGGYKTNKQLVLSSGFKSLVTFYRAYNSYING